MKVQCGKQVRFYSIYTAAYTAALVGLFSAMLLGCELLKEDIFPASFGQELAFLDLGDLKRAAGVPDTVSVWETWYIPAPQHNKQFLVVPLHQVFSRTTLAVLDARSLSLLKTFSGIPVGPSFALLDMDGYLVTGYGQNLVRINPATLEVEQTLSLTESIDFARAGFTAQNGTNINTYLVGFENGYIKLQEYNTMAAYPNTLTKANIFADTPAGQFVFQDLLYDGSRVFLALLDTMSQRSYILRWNSLQGFIDAFSGSYLAANADSVIPIDPMDWEGLRLSTKGYFIRLHDKVEKLVRYDLEGDNRVLDSFPLPKNFRGRAGVYSDGSAWLLYDERKNTLQLLRPWW